MIIPVAQDQEKALVGSSGGKTASTSIKMTGKVFQIISAGLYKDRILAIVRELSTNAWDSHIAAGETRDFKVFLPTLLKPEFRIRDYGTGMDEETVFQVFNCLFESTKTTSNDFNGMLGLGSKSPFSYTNMMSVTSYQNGTVKWYNMFVDETGLPSLTKLGEAQTTEPNGLEINFAVEPMDFKRFEGAAAQVSKAFIRGPKPEFNIPVEKYDLKEFVPGVFFCKRDISADVYPYYHLQVFAIQGNVAYPVPKNLVSCFEALGLDQGLDIFLEFPIGSLEFATSREELTGSSQNAGCIKEVAKKAASAIHAQIEVELKSFPTDPEKAIEAHDECFFKEVVRSKMEETEEGRVLASILRDAYYCLPISSELDSLINAPYASRDIIYKHSYKKGITLHRMRQRLSDTVFLLIDEKKYWRARSNQALKDKNVIRVNLAHQTEEDQELFLTELELLTKFLPVVKVSELPQFVPTAKTGPTKLRNKPYTWFREVNSDGSVEDQTESRLEDLLDYPEQEVLVLQDPFPQSKSTRSLQEVRAAQAIGAIDPNAKLALVRLSSGRNLDWDEGVFQGKFGKNVGFLENTVMERLNEMFSEPDFEQVINSSRKIYSNYMSSYWNMNLEAALGEVDREGENPEDYLFLKELVDIKNGLCDTGDNLIDELSDVLPELHYTKWIPKSKAYELHTKIAAKLALLTGYNLKYYPGEMLRMLKKREGE